MKVAFHIFRLRNLSLNIKNQVWIVKKQFLDLLKLYTKGMWLMWLIEMYTYIPARNNIEVNINWKLMISLPAKAAATLC